MTKKLKIIFRASRTQRIYRLPSSRYKRVDKGDSKTREELDKKENRPV
jgi:hypothetical protein